MDIKDILLILTGDQPNEARTAVATRLAREHTAKLTAVCLYRTPEPPLAEDFAIGAEAVASVIERESVRVAQLLAPVEAAFIKVARGLKPPARWLEPVADEAPEASMLRARIADLVVMGRPVRDPHASVRLAEVLALGGGAPLLVIPEGAAPPTAFDRVVLAWNGSREAKRALDDGLPFLQRAAAVEVVIVDEPHRLAAELQVDGLLDHLALHGVTGRLARVESGSSPVAETLVQHCADIGADLMIMGAYGRSRAAETILGGVTRTLFAHPPLPLLASR